VTMNYYKNFMAAVRCGSISKAAKSLFMSQSSLSRQIQAIEQTMGTPLLLRGNRSVRLTPGGQILYSQLPEIISLYERMKMGAQEANLGGDKLRIGILEMQDVSDVFPPAIGKFREKFPNIQFSLTNCSEQKLIEQLYANRVDMIYTYEQTLINQSGLIIEPIHTSNVSVMLSQSHPLAQKNEIYLDELQSELIIQLSGFDGNTCIDKVLRENGATVKVTEVGEMESLLLWIENGLAVAFTNSRSIARHNPQIAVRKLADFAAQPCSLVIAWMKENSNPLVGPFAESIGK